MGKTKIEWYDRVWNPVLGGLKGSVYNYYRRIIVKFFKKFADAEFEYRKRHNIETSPLTKPLLRAQIKRFEPVFMFKNYHKSFPKKPSRILVNSMSDIRWWKKEWMSFVLDKIERYPQHIFQFLTNFPKIYTKYKFPKNCWLGITIHYVERKHITFKRLKNDNIKFIFSDHLVMPVPEDYFDNSKGKQFPNWIIIGTQIDDIYRPPSRELVKEIIKVAKENNIPIFLRDNLFRVYPDLPKLQEFPNFPKLQELPKLEKILGI